MSYLIYGYYKGEKEIIDEADTTEEAKYLQQEYKIAYGTEWRIGIKKVWK